MTASGQSKADDVDQIKKELAALRAEVKALKEEVARLTKRDEEEKATKLKALREEVARLTKDEEEVKAKKHLAEVVETWKGLRAAFTLRRPQSFLTIPAVAEAVSQKGEDGAIPVFAFRLEKRELAPRKNNPNGPRETYEVSLYVDGVLARVPDPGVPFGLDLTGIGVSATDDVRLKGLGGLKSLIWLNLSTTIVKDAALEELPGLKNLKWLDLRWTRVTDAGLKELAGLKNLQSLDLQGTQVTEAGVAALQKALPACKIQR